MIRLKLFFPIVCALIITTTSAAADDLRMTASTWPPYVDKDIHNNGFAIALVTEAFKRAGYSTNMSVDTWPRALEATQNGDYDVYCALWFTEDRAATLAFSEPYVENPIVFIKRSDSDFKFSSRADLNGLRVGIVNDYAYREQPYDTTGLDVVEAGSVTENLKSLLAGDIDLVVADGRVALYEVNKLLAGKHLTVVREPINTRGLRVAVSKKRADHSEIIMAFNSAISDMKNDGSYNAILANYRVNY